VIWLLPERDGPKNKPIVKAVIHSLLRIHIIILVGGELVENVRPVGHVGIGRERGKELDNFAPTPDPWWVD